MRNRMCKGVQIVGEMLIRVSGRYHQAGSTPLSSEEVLLWVWPVSSL